MGDGGEGARGWLMRWGVRRVTESRGRECLRIIEAGCMVVSRLALVDSRGMEGCLKWVLECAAHLRWKIRMRLGGSDIAACSAGRWGVPLQSSVMLLLGSLPSALACLGARLRPCGGRSSCDIAAGSEHVSLVSGGARVAVGEAGVKCRLTVGGTTMRELHALHCALGEWCNPGLHHWWLPMTVIIPI